MEKKLPIYKIQVSDSDELGVNYVAFVDKPAIEVDWMAFSEKKYEFAVNEEQRIVSGALMVANLPIYRRDEGGEYYVVFDAETIKTIVQRFFRKGFISNVNENHDERKVIDNVYLFESFLINKERGISTPKGFTELPDGSWFGSYHVQDEDTWNKVKAKEFKGFSVEGLFGQRHQGDKSIEVIEEIRDTIKMVEKYFK